MKKKLFQVAIDSPAASGAGTQAKLISKYFNFYYLDTGKLYRILGKLYLKNNRKINYSIFKKKIKSTKPFHLKNKNLLTNEIGLASAYLAKDKRIRILVNGYQKKIAKNPPKKFRGVCFDGRDITYEIMPKADVKIFMTADVKVRAKRRYLELKKMKHNVTFNEVLLNIKNRDKSDFNRKISPLKICNDAKVIDNSKLNIKQCFKILKQEIERSLVRSV